MPAHMDEVGSAAKVETSTWPVQRKAAAILLGGGLALCATASLPALLRPQPPRRLSAAGPGDLPSMKRAALEELLDSKSQQLKDISQEVRDLLRERMRRNSLAMADQEASWKGAGWCGVATNMLDQNQAGMHSFCSMDLDFWWNWGPETRNAYEADCAGSSFIPMIWGWSPDNHRLARQAGLQWQALMGYNEPDLYGPPPSPGGDYLSSGTFAPTFHCGAPELARNWRQIVMAFKQANPDGIVVSPAMADPSTFASTGPDSQECNSSPQMPDNHMRFCTGWMKCFRDNVMRLNCGDQNCWDVINVLQFHAYEYAASNLIAKVRRWESVWADDLEGTDGRTRKTLWLTEFAHAGSTDSNDPTGEAREFMEQSVSYLKSSPHVSGWSWFSQASWDSFEIDNVVPAAKFWSSALIGADGEITPLGQKYSELCSDIPTSPGP